MENKDLTRGDLVTYQDMPCVVVYPDSDRMCLIYPGDHLPARRGAASWVWSSALTPRTPEAPAAEDPVLEAVVATFRSRYGYARTIYGPDSAQTGAVVEMGYDLANRLYGEEPCPERSALVNRMFD